MRRSYPSLRDPLEERVNRLETDLYFARTAIVNLMPEVLRSALTSYYSVKTRTESYEWERDVTQQIIESSKLLPQTHAYFGERAMCPLCGTGSSSPYEDGFSVPEGLRRHLVGYGNTHQCDVTKAAFALARDCWNSSFRESEAEERRAHLADLERRRKSETLYQTELSGAPLLLEEGIPSYYGARDTGELIWAESRLSELGFSVTLNDKIKVYTHMRDDYVVYADPRGKGEISFAVYKQPAGTLRRTRASRSLGRFSLPDRWKHNLLAKFDAALNKVLG